MWKKKKIVLKETAEAQEPWDIECLVCDFQVKKFLFVVIWKPFILFL